MADSSVEQLGKRPGDPLADSSAGSIAESHASPFARATPRPASSPARRVLRFAWIYGGLPLLAILLNRTFQQEEYGRMWPQLLFFRDFGVPAFLFWLLLGVRAILLTYRPLSREDWAPRLVSLAVAACVLFAPMILRILAPTGLFQDALAILHPTLLLLATGWILVFLLMILHADAVAIRRRSALLGWVLALPLAGFAGEIYGVRLSRVLRWLSPEYFHPSVFEEMPILRSLLVTVGVALAFVFLTEALVGIVMRRSTADSRPSEAASAPPPSLLWTLTLTCIPFSLALAAHHPAREWAIRQGLFRTDVALTLASLLPLIGFFLLSLIIGLRSLARQKPAGPETADAGSDSHRPRRSRRAVYAITVTGGILYILEAAHPSGGLPLMGLFAAVCLMVAANVRDILQGRRAARQGLAIAPPEANAIRSLLSLRSTALWSWGVPRRRWLQWIMPPLFWALTFVILLAGVLIGRRHMGRPVTLEGLFSFAYYGAGFWTAYFWMVFAFGVAVPLLVFIPWRIAARFQAKWDPEQLRELAVTELKSWDLFWGVVVPPARLMLRFAFAAVLFLSLLTAFFDFAGHTVYRVSISLTDILSVTLLMLALGGWLTCLIVGFARRRRRSGFAAFGAGVLAFAATVLGLGALIAYFDIGRVNSVLTGVFLCLLAFLIVRTVRFAFSGIPDSVERLVGE